MDAEIMVPSAETPEVSNVLSLKPVEGNNNSNNNKNNNVLCSYQWESKVVVRSQTLH